MPVVAKVQEKYPEYMTNVDGKVDVVVTKAVDIWTSKIAPSAPVAMAKSALAAYPVKVEELLAQRGARLGALLRARPRHAVAAEGVVQQHRRAALVARNDPGSVLHLRIEDKNDP